MHIYAYARVHVYVYVCAHTHVFLYTVVHPDRCVEFRGQLVEKILSSYCVCYRKQTDVIRLGGKHP